jgi:NADH-quinone oxidoreductase subunit M
MDVSVSFPILTAVVFAPLLGAIILMFFPKEEKGLIRNTALFVMLAGFAISLPLLTYDGSAQVSAVGSAFPTMAFVEQYPWIESMGVSYLIGVDGISLWLVLLTTFLGPVVVLSTYSAVDTRVKEFMICILLLQCGMLGALVSLDAFLFYVFWEIMLVPMYFLIGVWGGNQRFYATIKFFLYTMVGSLLMLVAILYLYFQTGGADGAHSFSLAAMMAVQVSPEEQMWLFGAFALAFAIKVPMFPFHTWLPHAHVQAPTAGSVILAGVLLKMGTYGLIRYGMPLFPAAVVEFAPWMATLAVIGIVYGALVAMVQKDVKKLVAYSSVSHLGFCVLGLVALTTQGIEGSIFVMLAHGIATGGLFLAVGILYERRHTRLISDFGGLTKVVPVFATLFMIIVFTSAGLPGLAGFIGEFLVILGTGDSQVLFFSESAPLLGAAGPETGAFLFATVAATGVIFGAVYLLWMFQRVMFGPLKNPKNENLKDLNLREVAYMMPLVIMGFVMGLFPHLFLDKMHTSVDNFMDRMKPAIMAKAAAGTETAARGEGGQDPAMNSISDLGKVGRPTLSKAGSDRLKKLQEEDKLKPASSKKPKKIMLSKDQLDKLFKDKKFRGLPSGGKR